MNAFNTFPTRGFQEIDHTADWAYRVWADSLEALFKQAADGLYHLAGMTLTAAPQRIQTLSLQAVDPESLLVAWLNELLYLHEAHNLGVEVISQLSLNKTSLQATVVVRPVQQWIKDIKAVTYNNLAIATMDHGFEATLVLDV
jgi:SHS2 domain-containing protein